MTMKPALTVREWELAKSGSGSLLPTGQKLPLVAPDKPDEWYGPPHGIAALCLYGQPFGFTREDVALLRKAIVSDPHTKAFGAEQDALGSLADRIEALLPPEG